MPHPNDISRNVRQKPPIHLNERWLQSGKRSPASEIKVLLDHLDFAKWQNDQLTKSYLCDSQTMSRLFSLSLANLMAVTNPESCLVNPRLVDRALGKKFFLSSAYPSYPSEGFVKEDPKYFFHTALSTNQSITIDFVDSHELFFLIIGNRTDACHDRAQWLFYVIHDDIEFSDCDLLPVLIPEAFNNSGGPHSVTPLFGKRGRYISIFSPVYTALHFSFVKVF